MADKLTTLSVLQAHPEHWLSLREIKPGVAGVPDRTLRNWLSALVKDGSIESRGEHKGRRYRLRPGPIAGTPAPGTSGSGHITGTHDGVSSESLALKQGRPMSLTGGCFCARVRYRIDAPLLGARSCHCSRCRKAFSGSGSAYAEVRPDAFHWVSGDQSLSRYESTPGWGLCFCSTCGSTLCGTHEGEVHGVALGTVDNDPGVEIAMHLFVGSKAPWDHIGGSAPQYQEFPPGA